MDPMPRDSDSADLGGGPDSAFLTSSQMLEMLMVQEPTLRSKYKCLRFTVGKNEAWGKWVGMVQTKLPNILTIM